MAPMFCFDEAPPPTENEVKTKGLIDQALMMAPSFLDFGDGPDLFAVKKESPKHDHHRHSHHNHGHHHHQPDNGLRHSYEIGHNHEHQEHGHHHGHHHQEHDHRLKHSNELHNNHHHHGHH